MSSKPAADSESEAPDGPGEPPQPGAGSRGRLGRAIMFTLAGAVPLVLAVVAIVVIVGHHNATSAGVLRPSGIPAEVPTDLANLMQLGPLPGQQAPGFTLTDQNGQTVSLSSLRGKVVVLEFMDPHCTDICPIVSQEFVDAYHDLGPDAGNVVFAAVNVNQYFNSVTNVQAFSSEHGLNKIPHWHFLTGPVPALRSVWQDYQIDVRAPSRNGDIVHTSAVYFIDPQGHEAFLASPEVDHTAQGGSYLPAGQISQWGKGIALIARHLAR